MNIRYAAATRASRARVGVVALLLAFITVPMLSSTLAAQEPEAAASPTVDAAAAACSSADDLRFILAFVRDSLEEEDGLVPVAVGSIAALSEARTLAGLVAETYRPLVDDLVVSLQDLRDTLGDLDELDTVGAKLASIGESITEIGNAMDELSMQLQTPCETQG